jgi:hypothetical protein
MGREAIGMTVKGALKTNTTIQTYSVTVSYRRVDIPLVTSRVGYGESFADALLDADKQLSDGTWKRIAISTSETIANDLRGYRPFSLSQRVIRRAENVVIKVKSCVTEVVETDAD